MMRGGGKVGTLVFSGDTGHLPYPFTYLDAFHFCLLPVIPMAAVSGTPRVHRKKRFQIEDEDD